MAVTTAPTVAQYRELAAAINQATDGVPEGWQGPREPTRSAYQQRINRWHQLMSELYGGLDDAVAAARAGEASGIEALTTFLEADVICHRSGYVKADALKVLGRAELSDAIKRRLEDVILAAVDGPDRREFRSYAQLARKLDNPRLRTELERRAASSDLRTKRHAGWAIDALK
jgi:uncharacterized protein YukE